MAGLVKRVWFNDVYQGRADYPLNGSADEVLTQLREALGAGATLVSGDLADDTGDNLRFEFHNAARGTTTVVEWEWSYGS